MKSNDFMRFHVIQISQRIRQASRFAPFSLNFARYGSKDAISSLSFRHIAAGSDKAARHPGSEACSPQLHHFALIGRKQLDSASCLVSAYGPASSQAFILQFRSKSSASSQLRCSTPFRLSLLPIHSWSSKLSILAASLLKQIKTRFAQTCGLKRFHLNP